VQLRANTCFRRATHVDSHRGRGQERRGRNNKAKGKPRIQLPVSDSELLDELKTGKSTTALADEYNVSPGTIRNRLREHNKKAYDQIAKTRTSPKSNGRRKNLLSSAKLYEEWMHGKSIRDLAKKCKVSRQTITRRLKEYNEQEYKEIAKTKIMDSIDNRQKIASESYTEIVKQYTRKDKSAAEIAEEFNVSRPTITRILEKYGKEEYQRIAQDRILTGSTKELPVPMKEAMKKWETGATQEDLERLCGISYRQILEKLKAYDPARYKQVAERRGLGSIRAKKYGARSLFELNVKRILEKHGIHTKEIVLKLGKHYYRPDFPLLERNTIIEAMGLKHDWYWKRNKRKTKDYLRNKYMVVAVVPNRQIYEMAKKHLSRKAKVLRYPEFEQFVATSLEKVPNQKHLSPTKNPVRGAGQL
jgi:transposase